MIEKRRDKNARVSKVRREGEGGDLSHLNKIMI